MSDVPSLVKAAKLENVHCIVLNGRQKFLCFTKIKGKTWMVAVSDGIDVWCIDLDEDGLEAQRDLSNVASVESFLLRFRNGFISGDINIGRIGNKVTMSTGKGSSVIEMDLFEAKAAEKKAELQSILFQLADSCKQLEGQLETANQQIDHLKSQKGSAVGLGALSDLSPKKGPGQAKAKTTKVGMSVINPSSRKRKAATGVVFD